ncbi:MAG TPA: hypothetical protein VFS76_23505 [Pyrinomonadaceae bacterium]|nr:hypothetical protein [Pyrinomonadaceae bacterium]
MAATLSSNRGEARFVIELGARSEYADDRGFDSCVHLHGSHWNVDHTFPFSVSIDGLWLRAAELTALHDHISRWLHQPLDHLVAADLSAEFQLARLPGQSVHIRFGPRADTISGRHPVVSITYLAGALHGEFYFVTDQSCLGGFVEELSAAVNSF